MLHARPTDRKLSVAAVAKAASTDGTTEACRLAQCRQIILLSPLPLP